MLRSRRGYQLLRQSSFKAAGIVVLASMMTQFVFGATQAEGLNIVLILADDMGIGSAANKDTHQDMARMESALIGLQWSFVVTHARVVVVALRRSRYA